MREDYLRNCFGDFSSQIRKVNFDVSKVTLKHTHAYLEFATPEVAGMVLHSFHNKIMPKTNNIWRFNLEWARWQPRVKVKQSSSAGSKILCINNLGEGMGEDFIRHVFPSHLQSHILKVTLFEKPRPPSAMIEFSSHDVAASALERYTEESVCRKFSLTWCPTEQPGPSLPTNLLKRKRE
ncbi:uncharacterized protein LOC126791319 [Argentina anserina]|uniref:uncharacterized protein LOC126791319 n=1 Tax=Argentina anserina TaxID=57926 RepID=UPI00217631CC|nr:uncharacterized protein LOC126791319 [Potentilla anserina]